MTGAGPGIDADEPAVVTPGQVISGKFRVERVIGEGGMGVVVLATHLQLDERVALKFLKRSAMRQPDIVARFDREARASVRLKSEHVARVTDVGKTEDGVPYMVMEYLEGQDLGQLVTEGGPLPVQDAVDYLIQACEGVGEAHARGVVHRDLKPENLFLTHRADGWPVVKVLDFGISKAALQGPASVEMSGNTASIMGSPFYMSPEQLRSTRTVDHRADVWSLGVVLFELLTGSTVFQETTEITVLVAQILESPHRSLRALRPDAPPELEAVIDRCLAKDRDARYQNVAELAITLLPFAPRRSRISVERTTAISRSAGLVTDAAFQLPPSNFPPRMESEPAADSPSSATLRGGSVETIAPPATPRRRRLPPAVLFAGGVALLGLGSALAATVIRVVASPVDGTAAAAGTASAVAAATTAAPTTAATIPPIGSPGESASATPPPTTTTRPAPTFHASTPAHLARPHPTVRPKPTATTGGPNLDIQRER